MEVTLFLSLISQKIAARVEAGIIEFFRYIIELQFPDEKHLKVLFDLNGYASKRRVSGRSSFFVSLKISFRFSSALVINL